MVVNKLQFNYSEIRGVVTVVGDKKVDFVSSHSDYGLTEKDAKRLSKVMGLSSRYIVSNDKTTSDLCFEAASNLLKGTNTSEKDIGGLIFVTQSPDYSSPSTAISLQHRLGLPNSSTCFDMTLGCSGFVYGLATAFGFIEAGLDKIILCVGDVASKLVEPSDHVVAPIMGDAGSAILIERKKSKSTFNLYSDGSGYDALIIPNSGSRKNSKFDSKDSFLRMDGAAVFDFSIKRVPPMINQIMQSTNVTPNDINYFLLHQPNKYMLQNIKKRLDLEDEKVPYLTQSVYGNQNSASIPGTINGFLYDKFATQKMTNLIAGFGIGLSWGAAIIETDNIYSPKTIHTGA
jgi:3-oxoacyl-[acyl-carrier-protein] synthase-3